jgi:hypothetical protein
VPVDHDIPEQELRLALGLHTFTSASTRTKGEWGRITIKHIYREKIARPGVAACFSEWVAVPGKLIYFACLKGS